MSKIWNKIKDKFLDLVNMYRQIMLDRKNYKLYCETIEELVADPKSKFVEMNLKYSFDTHVIAYVTRIPSEFQQTGQDYIIQDKLNENTFFITEYLRKTLGFGDYITGRPEFFHIEDPTTNEVSLTYLAVWNYQPMIEELQKTKLLCGLTAVCTVVLCGLAYLGTIIF